MKTPSGCILAALLLISDMTLAGTQPADFNKAMKTAQAARRMAQSVDGEWRDVGKLLKLARKAAKKGNYTKALGLTHLAEFQSKAGYSQAMSQKNAGNADYLYN